MMNPREGLRHKLLRPVNKLRERRERKKAERPLSETNPAVLELASSLLREINIYRTKVPQWLTASEEKIRLERETDTVDISPLEFETPTGLYYVFENEIPEPDHFRHERDITFFPRNSEGQIDRDDGRTLKVWYQSTTSSTFPDISGNSIFNKRTYATAHLELIKDSPTPEEDSLIPNSSATADAIRQNFPELFGLIDTVRIELEEARRAGHLDLDPIPVNEAYIPSMPGESPK